MLPITPVRLLVPAAQPVVTAGAYTSGQSIGGKLSFDMSAFKDRPDILLQSLLLVDQAKQQALIDLLIFDSNPSGTTFTDNATLDIADADMIKLAAIIPISSYSAYNDNCAAYASNLAEFFRIDPTAASPTLYAHLVSRGTPTFAATSDVSLRLKFVAA